MSESSGRERVRCSSLVDWPVYPRLRHIVQGSERARNAGRGWRGRPGPTYFAAPKRAGNRRDVGRADSKTGKDKDNKTCIFVTGNGRREITLRAAESFPLESRARSQRKPRAAAREVQPAGAEASRVADQCLDPAPINSSPSDQKQRL